MHDAQDLPARPDVGGEARSVPRVIEPAIPDQLRQRISDPLISVVVTTHNYAEFLPDCLRSVQAQTYGRYECIVVDDASSDNTPSVVRELLDEWRDRRFRYVRLTRNLGQLGAQVQG